MACPVPFGFVILDRDSGEFFLRSKSVVFPSLTLAQLFGVDDGPLHEEMVKNIITINGADHGRLRNLMNPALAPRRVDRYRPAMREFLAAILDELPDDGEIEFIADFAKPYPSQVIAHVMGAPISDAPRLHHWSNLIQKQFDVGVLADPTQRGEVEVAVTECYGYVDELAASRRQHPGEDLITDLIQAEEAGDRLSNDELRNLVLDILVGGVDTSQSQLAHAIRLLAAHPDQWEQLRADPQGLAPKSSMKRCATSRSHRSPPGSPPPRSSTAGSRSQRTRWSWCPPGTPIATASRTAMSSTSPPTAREPACSRSALESITASAPTSHALRSRRR